MRNNNKKYQVQFPPSVKKVIEMFDYDRYDLKLVDESNCIRLTKLEEFIANSYHVQYGTDDYCTVEEVCFDAYKKLLKRGDFNE